MFLVPAMTEKALATIDATARTSVCCFTSVRGHLDAGTFDPPPFLRSSTEIFWATFGGIIIPGNERGHVVATLTLINRGPPFPSGDATFHFNNPLRGDNTCDTALSQTLSHYLVASCHINPRGFHAVATYTLAARPLGSSSANGGDDNSDDEGDNSDDTP